MTHCVISHEVEDYAKWRAAYDKHESARTDAGIKSSRVYQDANNPNVITVVAEGELSDLQAFANNPDLKTVMQEAGVKAAPNVMFVNDVT